MAESEPSLTVKPYVTLNDRVSNVVLLPAANPLQIIRNPRVPHLKAHMSNAVTTYCLVGPERQPLKLNRKQIADIFRLEMGFTCDMKKNGALITRLSVHGPAHHTTIKIYRSSATHQLADPSPEHGLLTSHCLARELSKCLGIHIRPSPIALHNVVASVDAGQRIDLARIRAVAHLPQQPPSEMGSRANTKKKFAGLPVPSKRAPPTVFTFFETGQINCCGAPSVKDVEIALEEIDDILRKQNAIDMSLVKSNTRGALSSTVFASKAVALSEARDSHTVISQANWAVSSNSIPGMVFPSLHPYLLSFI